MASTPAAAELTEAHRVQQAANAAAAALLVQRLWRTTVDPARLEASYAEFLAQVIKLILARREGSAVLAAKYAAQFRAIEISSPGIPRPARSRLTFQPTGADLDRGRIETSMRVTGLIPAKRAARLLGIDLGEDLGQVGPALQRKVTTATRAAGGTASAAAFRHVADGGRETLRDITVGSDRQDRTALGYMRVTKADPCYFCAMLASRGPEDGLYSPNSFKRSDPRWSGPGTEKVHDSCACTLEPVYSVDGKWPGRSREFKALWERSDGTITGFRQLYEGRAVKSDKRRL